MDFLGWNLLEFQSKDLGSSILCDGSPWPSVYGILYDQTHKVCLEDLIVEIAVIGFKNGQRDLVVEVFSFQMYGMENDLDLLKQRECFSVYPLVSKGIVEIGVENDDLTNFGGLNDSLSMAVVTGFCFDFVFLCFGKPMTMVCYLFEKSPERYIVEYLCTQKGTKILEGGMRPGNSQRINYEIICVSKDLSTYGWERLGSSNRVEDLVRFASFSRFVKESKVVVASYRSGFGAFKDENEQFPDFNSVLLEGSIFFKQKEGVRYKSIFMNNMEISTGIRTGLVLIESNFSLLGMFEDYILCGLISRRASTKNLCNGCFRLDFTLSAFAYGADSLVENHVAGLHLETSQAGVTYGFVRFAFVEGVSYMGELASGCNCLCNGCFILDFTWSAFEYRDDSLVEMYDAGLHSETSETYVLLDQDGIFHSGVGFIANSITGHTNSSGAVSYADYVGIQSHGVVSCAIVVENNVYRVMGFETVVTKEIIRKEVDSGSWPDYVEDKPFGYHVGLVKGDKESRAGSLQMHLVCFFLGRTDLLYCDAEQNFIAGHGHT